MGLIFIYLWGYLVTNCEDGRGGVAPPNLLFHLGVKAQLQQQGHKLELDFFIAGEVTCGLEQTYSLFSPLSWLE